MRIKATNNVMWGGTRVAAFAMAAMAAGLCVAPSLRAQTATTTTASETHVSVVFTGGHETDGRDRGRPVVLVAGALGVAPEVFREAFSHVHPAGPDSGGPTREEAQANKRALMDALGKYGIDNDRLDEVSNYYRYVRSHGEHWPSKPAEAYAIVVKGVVTGYVVTSGGSGYSSAPTISVPGIADSAAAPKVTITYSKTFAKNGAIGAISVADASAR